MRSLFGKIFLSFWIALALFLVSAILVTWIVRQRSEAGLEAAQSKTMSEAVQVYEDSGRDALRKYLDQVRELQHVRVYLFDDQGEELLGHQPPDWIRDAEHGRLRVRPGEFWGIIPPPRPQRLTMVSSSGRRYAMLTLRPPSGPFGPSVVPWRGLLILVLSSGLVCYVLARSLTAPVARLRAATQKLASGDLTARAGEIGSRRRDEIAQLVRDFDSMAERLEKIINAQSRLLNDISHELRSPLARLNVALALARQRTGPEAQSALERIDLESERLNALIERLLTVARLESGEEGLRRASVGLDELVNEITEDADFEAQGRGCHVKAVIADDCVVTGNAALLHSAIENVVRNATRYTRDGTDVEVKLEQAPGLAGFEAIVRVTDSGPGVPEESLDKLFRPFYRIDDARGRRTGGVGLGLAITERAIRLHGGTVRAANRPQGGLMVEIRLPIVRSAEVVSAVTAAIPVEQRG